MQYIEPIQKYLNKKSLPKDKGFPRFPSEESYLFFKKNHPKSSITIKEYKTIIYDFIEKVKDTLIDYRDGVDLTGVGYLVVVNKDARKRTSGMRFYNIKESIKQNKLIPSTLTSIGNKVPVATLNNKAPKYKIKNKRLWLFIYERSFRRRLFKEFLKTPGKYLKVHKKSVTELNRIMDPKYDI